MHRGTNMTTNSLLYVIENFNQIFKYVICLLCLILQVCRDPRWGRCYESYSEDHRIVQLMTEIIPGLQGELLSNSKKGVPFVAPGK